MLATDIDSTRLKTIRKGRKIGRPKLAKLSGISERNLARIESGATTNLQLNTDDVAKLAAALNVPVEVLTGEFDVEASDFEPVQKSTCTSGCCG